MDHGPWVFPAKVKNDGYADGIFVRSRGILRTKKILTGAGFLDYSCNGMPSKLVIPRGDSIVFLAINSLQSPCLPYRKLAAQALQTVKEHLEVSLLQVLSVSIPHLSPSVQSSPYSPLSASTPAGPAIQGSRFAPPAQLPSLKRHEVQFLPPHLRLRRDCCF